jgi:hypothetical protein
MWKFHKSGLASQNGIASEFLSESLFAMCRSFLFLDGTVSVSGWKLECYHQQW